MAVYLWPAAGIEPGAGENKGGLLGFGRGNVQFCSVLVILALVARTPLSVRR